jgi:hypothetical protein
VVVRAMNVSVFGRRLVAAPIRFRAHSSKETHVSPKETVIALYAAFASGDPQRISDLLHEDVVWVAPPGNAT